MNQEPVAAGHTSKDKKTRIQVIARAASVLRALEHEPAGLSLGALAKRLQLPRSTVQRIVGALEAESLLIAASPAGGVKLGPALLRLSAAVATSVSRIAKPHMLKIANDLQETVNLSMLSRGHAICVDQAAGAHHPAASPGIGETSPLHCSASGKSILALFTDAEIEQKLGRVFASRTEHTHTTLNALLSDIHEARRTGIACDLQEYTPGICAVGVGFRDSLGNRLALSMPMATGRFAELKSRAAERLTELRDLLSAHGNPK